MSPLGNRDRLGDILAYALVPLGVRNPRGGFERDLRACPMKLGRGVSRHNELDNWRNTHRYESVIATIWLFLTRYETDPGLWDRLLTAFKDPRATRDPPINNGGYGMGVSSPGAFPHFIPVP